MLCFGADGRYELISGLLLAYLHAAWLTVIDWAKCRATITVSPFGHIWKCLPRALRWFCAVSFEISVSAVWLRLVVFLHNLSAWFMLHYQSGVVLSFVKQGLAENSSGSHLVGRSACGGLRSELYFLLVVEYTDGCKQ
jgi:hypothetical protein